MRKSAEPLKSECCIHIVAQQYFCYVHFIIENAFGCFSEQTNTKCRVALRLAV